MNLTDSYKLSLYGEIGLIKESDYCTVKLVVSSLDGKRYIKKEYADNKMQVFSVLQRIHSANLPEIKDIIDGRIIIEEFVEGVTLERFLQIQNGVPDQKRAKIIFDGILSALNELHKNGIVHRDVKPSNVIVRPNGTAVLIDFGISKIFNPQADKDTSFLGTVGYAPPEQFGFSSTDYRSDIYSFGVTAEKLNVKKYNRITQKCKSFDPSKRYANAGRAIADTKRINPWIIAAVVIGILFVFGITQRENKRTVAPEIPELPSGTSVYFDEVYGTAQSETFASVQQQTQSATEELTQPLTENQTQTFLTTRRLQLFDHPKPYRVIETDEHIYSILIMAAEADERIIAPTGDGGEIEVHYVLDRNNLKLTLTDGKHRFEAEYSAAQITMGEYLSKGIMTEIVFYDISGDGIYEIIPLFRHNDYTAEDGKLGTLVNSWEGYCIEYSPENGFRQCDGELRVRGSQSESLYVGDGRIYDDSNPYGYTVSDGKFRQQEG